MPTSDSLADAIQLLQRGDLRESRRVASALVDRQPPDARALQLLGRIDLQEGRAVEAAAHFGAALRLFPGSGSLLGDLGQALLALGRLEEAVEALTAAVRTDAESRRLWQLLAECHQRLGQTERAQIAYRRSTAAHTAEVARLPPNAQPNFHFLRDNEPLTAAEYARARSMVMTVKGLVAARDGYLAGHAAARDFVAGGSVWGTDTLNSIEIDGARPGYLTSYELVATADYRILDRLRLYCQAFSGYQLATLSLAWDSAWIREPLPLDVDRLMLAPRAREVCPSIHEYRFLRDYVLGDLDEISFPPRFGEVGWLIGGAIVNYDLTYYLSLIGDLVLSGIFRRLRELSAVRPAVIVEIGGGFGGLAYLLQKAIPNCHYVIIDLPESLMFSATYLGTLLPKEAVTIVDGGQAEALTVASPALTGRLAAPGVTIAPNYTVDALRRGGLRADLVINTISLDEMRAVQVETYGRLIAEMLRDGAFFFEVNLPSVVPHLSRHLREAAPPSSMARTKRHILWRDERDIRYWQRKS